jgi:hypothetical protein
MMDVSGDCRGDQRNIKEEMPMARVLSAFPVENVSAIKDLTKAAEIDF